jgi:DHA1 family bicyclomycin/chloramphenicol resistance-like MFS transporter
MATSSIGNGLSQPTAMAAGLSVRPRIAGTASGVMGFLQMAVSALGTFAVALLPPADALSIVAVVGAAQAVAFVCGIAALRRPSAEASTGVAEPEIPL